MKKPKTPVRKKPAKFDERICVTLTPEQQRVGNLVLKSTKFYSLSHAVGGFIAYAANLLLPPHERTTLDDFFRIAFHPKNLKAIANMKPEEGQ